MHLNIWPFTDTIKLMQSSKNMPHTSYIICATARCGSHFLANALQNTELAGKPDEYFQANEHGQLQNETGLIAEYYGEKDLEAFRKMVLGFGSSSNGVFGIIIHWSYLQDVIKNYASLPQYQGLGPSALFDAIFYNPKYIWIRRLDKLRQAISYHKAEQNNVWYLPEAQADESNKARIELKYDYFMIDFLCDRFVIEEKGWASFFKTQNIEPFIVAYEDFIDSYEQTTRQLLDYLKISLPSDFQIKEATSKKQADALTDKWVQKYLRQKKSLLHFCLRILRYSWLKFYHRTPIDFKSVSRAHYS